MNLKTSINCGSKTSKHNPKNKEMHAVTRINYANPAEHIPTMIEREPRFETMVDDRLAAWLMLRSLG